MITVDGKYTKDVRREYQKDYRRKKKGEEGERMEAEIKERGVWYERGDGAFNEFIEHVRGEAMKKGASSAIMGIYKEMLKLSVALGKGKGMSGDEVAGLILEAERELEKGGYKGEGGIS